MSQVPMYCDIVNVNIDKIKFTEMEVKQEVNEYTCKGEIDNDGGDLFDTFKVEINEALKRESRNDAFDDLIIKENPIKIENETCEDKLILFEEETSEKNTGF
ncbi:unnamed protein product [Diabrotica balteata]|uniref:Uncharacterized protein n=1 Tax=Diabrotica balteata TaxID=107213 RepID=A0A9N9XGM7_DIABA|nr:unnamed protein product [Diabrotica balteata]